MSELLHDTNFWVAVSFVIFMIVAWKFGKDTAMNGLDSNIDAIKTELNQAEQIRVDAQELLAEYQRKHKDAMSEADRIIADAKKHAEDIREKAESDMERANARRETQLDEKLNRLEQQATQDIQSYTAQIAVNAARDLLKDKIDDKTDKTIIANVATDISKSIN